MVPAAEPLPDEYVEDGSGAGPLARLLLSALLRIETRASSRGSRRRD